MNEPSSLSQKGWRRLSENVFRYVLHWKIGACIPMTPVAVFLVKHNDGDWTLVDSGCLEHSDDLVEAVMEQTGKGGLKFLLITHGHLDHAGGISAFLRSFPEVRVICHEHELQFITGEQGYRSLSGETLCSPFNFFKACFQELHTHLTFAEIARIDVVQDGFRGVDDIEVIHCPGHTPGSLSFYHQPSRSLFCGDAFMYLPAMMGCRCCGGDMPVLSGPNPLSTPQPTKAFASMKRLLRMYQDFTLYPTHDQRCGVTRTQVQLLLDGSEHSALTASEL
eukprot:TRINITY_DN11645_c0_g1_i1.p1 TRINITY_DN11645_c0_g1~~TRINITY_DN11645_c0_g1_i1.p1  ORF type:complete len:278 (+),score=35.36 TRINITY_DN11645_c0_g1_i1:14-847(+)